MRGKVIIGLLFILFCTITIQALAQKKYVIIGYVGGYKGLIDTAMVNARKLTIINYAFIDVQHNRAKLTNGKTDTLNFKYLLSLKNKNPGLKVMISIGGWTWSKNFSDAVLSDTSREAFAASAVSIVQKYNLDGVDIDWEYPGLSGDGNTFRPEDKQNYTLMFREIRNDLDMLQKQTGKKLLLTAAVGAFTGFIQHTEMGKVQQYLNYVNLMTYDYFQDSLGMAVHHTGLYGSKKYASINYADQAVTDFEAAGVPAGKLVMGLAFYARSAKTNDSTGDGLGSKIAHLMYGGGYTYVKDSLINKKGFKYYRDDDAKAPYLFNATTRQFISFDDEWSVGNKCRYIRDKGMAGAMFWEYADDKKEYLINAVDRELIK